jgi:hypothetical protein
MFVEKKSHTGITAMGIFLFFGATMASLAGATLTWRGTILDRMWALIVMHLHTDSLHRSGKQSGFHYTCSVEPWQSLARLGSSAAFGGGDWQLPSSQPKSWETW